MLPENRLSRPRGDDRMKISEARDKYIASLNRRKSASTLRRYASTISQLMTVTGDIEISRVTHEHMDRFFEDRSETHGANTLNAYVSGLRMFFRWTHARGYTRKNPTSDLAMYKVDPVDLFRLAPDQFGHLLDGATGERDRMIVLLGLTLFLRASEMATITLGDISWEGSDPDRPGPHIRVHVWKSNLLDWMPVSATLERGLVSYLDWYASEMGYNSVRQMMIEHPEWHLVPARQHGRDRLNPSRPVQKVHEIIQRALSNTTITTDLKGLGEHLLRRSGALAYRNTLIKNDLDPYIADKVIMKWLHHKNIEETWHYLGFDREEADRESVIGQEMWTTEQPTVVRLAAVR